MAAVNTKLFIQSGGMAEGSMDRLASSPASKGPAGHERKREKNLCFGSDTQTKLNFLVFRTFFRKAKGSHYYLHKINAPPATQEGKSQNTANQKPRGKAVWPHPGSCLTICIRAKAKI